MFAKVKEFSLTNMLIYSNVAVVVDNIYKRHTWSSIEPIVQDFKELLSHASF